MRKFIYLLASCLLLCACQNDNEQDKNDSIGAKVRVKRIVGENEIWGKYEMLFNYHADGRLANACRLDRNKEDIIPDTVGSIVVVYDYNYYNLKLMDHVLNIDNDSVRYLKDLYPDSYEDTLRQRRIPRVAYSIEFKDDRFIMQRNRPRKKTGSGKFLTILT